MAVKFCNKCQEYKSTEGFCGNKASSDGLKCQCKTCDREDNRQRYNKQCSYIKTQKREYYSKNKSKVLSKQQSYYQANKEEVKDRVKEYYINNKISKLAYAKQWRKDNHDKVKQNRREYYKKCRDDFTFRLIDNLRKRLHKLLTGKIKRGSHIRDLGCSADSLKWYLESQFEEGMTWDNYGEWEVDHILPLSKFDLEDKTQLSIACHVSNLQPLWKADNIRKSNN